MSNTCTVVKAIERVSQVIADFLPFQKLSPKEVRFLVGQIELVAGAVRELPMNKCRKFDILHRLQEAKRLLKFGAHHGTLVAVLQLLQLVALKVSVCKIPCAQGRTIVHPICKFNTACHC